MACNCGGKKSVVSVASSNQQQQANFAATQAKGESSMNDSDYELVKYLHPNRGQHPVYGHGNARGVPPRFYGFRAGGETFLVHRADIAAAPNLYSIISKVPATPAVKVPPPPPPEALSGVTIENIVSDLDPIVPIEQEQEPTVAPPTVIERATKDAKFNLDLVPGVTPAVAKEMVYHGLGTPQAILDAGVEGLIKVKGIAQTRAYGIYNYVKDKYA